MEQGYSAVATSMVRLMTSIQVQLLNAGEISHRAVKLDVALIIFTAVRLMSSRAFLKKTGSQSSKSSR